MRWGATPDLARPSRGRPRPSEATEDDDGDGDGMMAPAVVEVVVVEAVVVEAVVIEAVIVVVVVVVNVGPASTLGFQYLFLLFTNQFVNCFSSMPVSAMMLAFSCSVG